MKSVHPWQRQRKLVQLPGTPASPQLVLARTLEKAKRIKSVAISIEWDDGTFAYDCSDMMISYLLLHSHSLAGFADDAFIGGQVDMDPEEAPPE